MLKMYKKKNSLIKKKINYQQCKHSTEMYMLATLTKNVNMLIQNGNEWVHNGMMNWQRDNQN